MTADAALAARPQRLAWVVWGLGALCFAYAFFHRVAPSVMVADLMRDFAIGGAILGNLSAVYFYSYVGLQIPVGLIIDRWGPRRVLAAALAVAAAGSVLFSAADGIGVAYLGRGLVGAGVCFAFVGTLTLATNWFPARRFALLSGLTMLAGMAGGVIGQAPQAALVETLGWRSTVLAAGLVGAALAALIWLVVRDSPGGGDGAASGRAASARQAMAGLGRVLGNPQTWVIALYGGMMSGTMLAFGALWAVPYLTQTYGLARPAAAFSASLVMLGWAAGGPLAGWLSDHFARRKLPMLLGAAAGLMTIVPVLYLPDLPLLAVQALLFLNGAAGGSMVICYAVAREHNPGPVGAAYGFTNMATVSGGALLQPFIGWLLDLQWTGTMEAGARVYSVAAYEIALATFPVSFVIAIAAGLFIRETRARPITDTE